MAQKVTISVREGLLRYSPHFYNSQEEIAIAVEVTRESLRVRSNGRIKIL
jgi:hypothetical protein